MMRLPNYLYVGLAVVLLFLFFNAPFQFAERAHKQFVEQEVRSRNAENYGGKVDPNSARIKQILEEGGLVFDRKLSERLDLLSYWLAPILLLMSLADKHTAVWKGIILFLPFAVVYLFDIATLQFLLIGFLGTISWPLLRRLKRMKSC